MKNPATQLAGVARDVVSVCRMLDVSSRRQAPAALAACRSHNRTSPFFQDYTFKFQTSPLLSMTFS
jgi:hypothetical protein